MDNDSSNKFIGSLTKFLQSLCNGYVEFQRGVELVGHIYLNIDTGEKVDYILHEKVSKNDENSVTFVSNSFHAQPVDKKLADDKEGSSKSRSRNRRNSDEDEDDDDDNDIMIVDQSDVPGSTNSGTIPSRSGKYMGSSGSSSVRGSRPGSMNPMSSPNKNRQLLGGPSSTVTSQDMPQGNINIGDVKLEQLSTDELLSLASQVGGEGGSSQSSQMVGQHGGPAKIKRSSSLGDGAGQPTWIKQELPDDLQGGSDTGWSHGRDGQSDTSNSGSDLYPVMMHHNPAYSSNPVFPGFSSVSGQSSASGSRHLGHSQSHPGMSGAGNLYANPMPGTSQGMGGMDPAVPQLSLSASEKNYGHLAFLASKGRLTRAEAKRLYRARIKVTNPERHYFNKMKNRLRMRQKREEMKLKAIVLWRWGNSKRDQGTRMTYWQKVIQDPVKHERYKAALRERMRRLRARRNKAKMSAHKPQA